MTPASYKVLFAAQWAFPVFIIAFVVLMPESPWYLVRNGKFEQASKALKALSPPSDDVDAKLETIKAEVELEQSLAASQSGASYMDCFRGTNFRRTRIVCGMFITQQFTGIAFYAQALYFLGISGLPIALTFQLALGGFAVAMAGNVVSWFIMNYVGKHTHHDDQSSILTKLSTGRRTLLLTGIVLNAAICASVGVAGCFTTMAAIYYIGYVMNFAQLFYAPTVGAVSWTISAETSSVRLRAKTQSLGTITNALVSWVMNFITPYLINTDTADLGGKAAFVWAGLCVITFLWAWFEVPEFRDLNFADMELLFLHKTPTRKFGPSSTDTPEE